MNDVLERVLKTQSISDGMDTLPLRHVDFPTLPVHMDRMDGEFLAHIIREVRPSTSLEVGMAFGVSTMFICEALAELGTPARHIVADPFQRLQWRGIGLRHLAEARLDHLVDFREERSEYLLPKLAEGGTEIDFALIDGWHTFDQVMVEFYYIDRMLRPGGVIAFDDADRRSVSHAVRYALQIPGYEVFPAARKVSKPVTLAGRARRLLNRLPNAHAIFRPDFLARDWDLGIGDRCVAIRKRQAYARPSSWYREF
jgi:predicted O-methyltransferase YrrM